MTNMMKWTSGKKAGVIAYHVLKYSKKRTTEECVSPNGYRNRQKPAFCFWLFVCMESSVH